MAEPQRSVVRARSGPSKLSRHPKKESEDDKISTTRCNTASSDGWESFSYRGTRTNVPVQDSTRCRVIKGILCLVTSPRKRTKLTLARSEQQDKGGAPSQAGPNVSRGLARLETPRIRFRNVSHQLNGSTWST
jgi:hypothetical protein